MPVGPGRQTGCSDVPRTTPFTLAAEIRRRLLPASFTCEADSFTLSAWLEPAAGIGGDTFDYSLARDLLHLSITDAVGHGGHGDTRTTTAGADPQRASAAASA